MPSYLPYLLLGLICIPLAAWLLLRRGHLGRFSRFVLFLAYVGMIYIFEFIILVVLDCYEYTPKFVPIRYQDNILGAIVSDMASLPAFALLIAVFQLSTAWIIFFILLFGGVEWWFEKISIYYLHWWKIPYTAVSLVFYFHLARTWLLWLKRGLPIVRFLTLLLFNFSLLSTMTFILSLLGFRLFELGVYSNVYRDDVFTASLFVTYLSIIYSTTVFFTEKIRWRLAALGLAGISNGILALLSVNRILIPLLPYYAVYLTYVAMVLWLTAAAHHSLLRLSNPSAGR